LPISGKPEIGGAPRNDKQQTETIPMTTTQQTITRISHRMLDVVGAALDIIDRRYAPANGEPLTPIAAAPWRWTNNAFGFWQLCAKPVCRRARCCRGEPRACLDRHLPQVPHDVRNRVCAMLRARRASQVGISLLAGSKNGLPSPPCLAQNRSRGRLSDAHQSGVK
jgi:hypothetical protein